MAFGAIIIGDEILSGRRSDKHLAKLIELLGKRGLRLQWAQYVGDDLSRLQRVLGDSFERGNPVFSFGGIGATPDDLTRQAVAAALGVELQLHPEAEQLIRQRFGKQITPHRLQMGFFPRGSAIIPNAFNQIPGFAIAQHYFVPGFPIMAWPMVEWVLDTHFSHLHHVEDYVEQAVIITGAHEGHLIDLMEQMTVRYPELNLFSLPTVTGDANPHGMLELGVKGSMADVNRAMDEIKAELSRRKLVWQDDIAL